MLKEPLVPGALPTRKPSILKHAASLTAVYEQGPGGEDVFMQVKAAHSVIQSCVCVCVCVWVCVRVCVWVGVGGWVGGCG